MAVVELLMTIVRGNLPSWSWRVSQCFRARHNLIVSQLLWIQRMHLRWSCLVYQASWLSFKDDQACIMRAQLVPRASVGCFVSPFPGFRLVVWSVVEQQLSFSTLGSMRHLGLNQNIAELHLTWRQLLLRAQNQAGVPEGLFSFHLE